MKLIVLYSIYLWGLASGSPTWLHSSTSVSGRIIGGNEVDDIRTYPHQVALLLLQENDNPFFFCGGSVLSENYVLTAAHCLDLILKNTDLARVRAGTIRHDDETSSQTVGVAELWRHPKYSGILDYDVGIIQVQTPLELNDNVVPIKLPVFGTTAWPIGTTVTVTGWGRTNNTDQNSVSAVLKEVHLPLVSAIECQLTTYGLFSDRLLCVYGLNRNFCNGDSGGPIISYGSTNFLIGIVTFPNAEGCAVAKSQGIVNVGNIDIRSFIYTITNL